LPFFSEIALDLARGAKMSGPAWDYDGLFDERVILAELARDVLLRRQQTSFFVETWHIGNLAHARIRNPSVASKYEAEISGRVSEFRPCVYFLDIPIDLMRCRTSHYKQSSFEHAVHFYEQVHLEIRRVVDLFRLDCVVIDASADVEVTTAELLRTAAEPGCSRSESSPELLTR
jgi:hypothetical protein